MLAVTIDFAIAPKATTGEASSDTLLATLPFLSNDAILFRVYFALFYQRSVVVAVVAMLCSLLFMFCYYRLYRGRIFQLRSHQLALQSSCTGSTDFVLQVFNCSEQRWILFYLIRHTIIGLTECLHEEISKAMQSSYR